MNELIKINTNEVSMTTIEIAEQTQKRSDHVKRDAKRMLLELYGKDSLPKFGEWYKADNGQEYECYRLPKNEILILVSGYSIPLRAAIVRRLDELEKQQMPQTLPEALRIYANEIEQRQLAEKQRDEAVRTKAEIGSRREATAMATASKFSKENDKLKEQIGDSKNYKQVKAIPWLKNFFNLGNRGVYITLGKQLAKLTDNMGYVFKKIPDSQYGSVKAYHKDVIAHLKYKLTEDHNMMRKYRRF